MLLHLPCFEKIPAERQLLSGYHGNCEISSRVSWIGKSSAGLKKGDFPSSQVQRGGGEDSEIEEIDNNACKPDQDRDAADDGDRAGLPLGLCNCDGA